MNIINVVQKKDGFLTIASFQIETKCYSETSGCIKIHEQDRERLEEINQFFIHECMSNNGVYKNVLKAVEKGFYKKGKFSIEIIESDIVKSSDEAIFSEENEEED